MSEHEFQGEWRRLGSLPCSRVEWQEEVIGRDGRLVHLQQASGTPAEAVERWRALILRCRMDRCWYAARVTIIEPTAE
jgi:hypothetical protein